MHKLLIATKNQQKLETYRKLLKNYKFQLLTLDDVGLEEQTHKPEQTFEDKAINLAQYYYKKSGTPTLFEYSEDDKCVIAIATPFGVMASEGNTPDEAISKVYDFVAELTK